MKVSGKGCSSWQRTLGHLYGLSCSQNSQCTAELSAGCRRPPWREKTAWRSASGPSPSTACKTRWGRQTSASWRMWCSTPEENETQKILNEWNNILYNCLGYCLFLHRVAVHSKYLYMNGQRRMCCLKQSWISWIYSSLLFFFFLYSFGK